LIIVVGLDEVPEAVEDETDCGTADAVDVTGGGESLTFSSMKRIDKIEFIVSMRLIAFHRFNIY